jgi:hypothetical protein
LKEAYGSQVFPSIETSGLRVRIVPPDSFKTDVPVCHRRTPAAFAGIRRRSQCWLKPAPPRAP